ncbi:RNA polymerase sigma factor [Cytobacillus purgationiresistens]|uniref:RNA polymerase sigma-70 factor (ECF subfamily) n=1 Tax=Cytobacillus purgationiresistens TaxID=863449 RepID=A0ABU0AJR5_9BACI|nr:RNA polymerase sigma factor [Cytobacillus purgationiresistens]MDQ0271512.1 RNA polymerase sigma-70 factor (ECF subfamily) [Cytobacillus purgationiresistens]
MNESIETYFEACVCEHGHALFRYIYSLVHHKELAEDLYQEVLISAYLALPSFNEEAKVKNWLFKIALNKCRDHWRKEKTAKKFWEEKVHLYTDGMSTAPVPEEECIQKCHQEEVEQQLSELPDIYKEPLFLFYYHHQTLVEISNEANLPLSTIKTRMRRGKEKLLPKVKQMSL